MNLWYLLLYQPLVNGLIFLYQILFQNLGWAIIGLTFLIRFLLLLLTLPSFKTAQKMRELAPELERLKKKYRKNQTALARAQFELYRQKRINPTAGCLPQIIQLVVLIALYQAFIRVLQPNGNVIERLNEVLYLPLKLSPKTTINTRFFYLDLTQPDVFRFSGLPFPLPGVFLVTAALIQFFSAKRMQPSLKMAEKKAQKTPAKTDDLAVMMQTQMTYFFPLMTILIGFSFPSGLILYWLVFSLFSLLQPRFGRQK